MAGGRSHHSWQRSRSVTPAPRIRAPGADYATALAAVQAGHADGITYVLTEDDPFAAIDLDHCRDVNTRSIDVWAQNFLDTGRHSYSEVTPSGAGCRIWGLASGDSLHKKFTLQIDGKEVAAELFRRTNKALTITGYRLDTIRELANIDRMLDWAVVWGERRKAAAAEAAAPATGQRQQQRQRLQRRSDRADRAQRSSGRGEPQQCVSHGCRALCRLRLECRADPAAPATIPRRHWRPLSQRRPAEQRDRQERRQIRAVRRRCLAMVGPTASRQRHRRRNRRRRRRILSWRMDDDPELEDG